MAARYRKKPVTIEAMQMPEKYPPGVDPSSDNYARNLAAAAVYSWVESNSQGSFDFLGDERPECGVSIDPSDGRMVIATLEGDMHVSAGDWVIRGVAGEFYPCKPDIFAATYEGGGVMAADRQPDEVLVDVQPGKSADSSTTVSATRTPDASESGRRCSPTPDSSTHTSPPTQPDPGMRQAATG